jgi:simple sugar transport system substrate-binding protein
MKKSFFSPLIFTIHPQREVYIAKLDGRDFPFENLYDKEKNEMKSKKMFLFISVLLILSTIIAACAKETATSAPTTGASAPTTAAPATTEGGAPAAGTNWCSNTSIVFFPGGPSGGPFATVVYNGAVQAAKDTGADVQYVWSDWDPATMITQFQQAMATNPDGIAVMGHPGDEAFDPLIEQAESQGIIVTSMNVQLPKMQAKYSSNGFGYAGAIQYSAGHALGAEAVKESGLGSGDTAFLWGLLSQAGRGERTKGVKDALEEAGMTVVYQEIDDKTNADAAAGVPVFTGIMSAHPEIKMVITDHGALTGTMETYLTAAGKEPGEVFAAGFDVSGNAITAIQDGYLQLVSDQQQWLQGYFGVLQLCLTNEYHFSGLQIDTGAGFVTKSNLDTVAPLIEKQIR